MYKDFAAACVKALYGKARIVAKLHEFSNLLE